MSYYSQYYAGIIGSGLLSILFDLLSDISLTQDVIFHKLLALNGDKALDPDALHPH